MGSNPPTLAHPAAPDPLHLTASRRTPTPAPTPAADAKTMAPKPVASVRMPRRVPYGFHGTWVAEQQLKSQVMWV